jgi:hypothetical protein
VWGGSGRWLRSDIGLDAQPANPDLGRLSMSKDSRYHVIRWNVGPPKSRGEQ